jgi:hypothetical protein
MSSLAALSGGFTPPNPIPAKNANTITSHKLCASSVGRMKMAATRNAAPPTIIRALMWSRAKAAHLGTSHS